MSPARSRRIEQPDEFAILEISQFPGDDRSLASDEEQLAILRDVADLIGGQQRPANMLLAMGYARGLGVQRAAHGLENDRLLAEEIGDEACAVMIVNAEDLEDAGVCMKPISRASGRSAVASAAYRAAERLTNERDGLTHCDGAGWSMRRS